MVAQKDADWRGSLASGPRTRTADLDHPPLVAWLVAPFSGFAVSVDTEPSGALVSVGGVPRGEAPVLAGLDCSPGDPVEISAQKAGFAVARTTTTCRRDTLVKLTVRLAR